MVGTFYATCTATGYPCFSIVYLQNLIFVYLVLAHALLAWLPYFALVEGKEKHFCFFVCFRRVSVKFQGLKTFKKFCGKKLLFSLGSGRFSYF